MDQPMDLDALLSNGDFVRGLARALIADPHRADDAAQDAWAAVLRQSPDGGSFARAWFVRVFQNAARQVHRSEARRAHREILTARPEAVPSAAEVVEREETRRIVVESLLGLDEPYRSALLLRFYEGLPPREVAARLGVPVETARTRIRRGVDLLRQRLDGRATGGRQAWSLAVSALVGAPAARLGPAAAGSALFMKASVKVAAVAALLLLGIGVGWAVWPSVSSSTGGGNAQTLSSAALAERASVADTTSEGSASRTEVTERVPAAGIAPAVKGRVVNLQGEPIPGAVIAAAATPIREAFQLRDALAGRGGARAVKSAADGRFTVPLFPGESALALALDAKGYSPTLVESAVPGDDLTIRLERAQVLTGHVVDESGAPIAGARVTWCVQAKLVGFELDGVSGADGIYRIEGIPSSRELRLLSAFSPRFDIRADGFATVSIASNFTFLTKGPSVPHDWILNRGVKFSGRVVDDELDTPVPGARIVLWTTGGIGSTAWNGVSVRNPYHERILEESTSGADGGFTFAHAPGASVHLQRTSRVKDKAFDAAVLADGYAPVAFAVDAEPDGSAVDRVVRVRRGATVRGRVLDETGKPLSGVTVYVPRSGEGQGWIPPLVMPDVNPSGTTAGDGTYEIRGIPASVKEPKSVNVRISANENRLRQLPESSPARREADVEIRAGKIANAPDLVLPRAALAASNVLLTEEIPIDVTVVDADGNGVAGALLQVVPFYFAVATTTTDAQGKGRIIMDRRQAGLSESRSVQITAPGYALTVSAPFTPRSNEPVTIRLVLTRARLVKGMVLRGDGSPANAASIRAYPEGVRPSSRPVDPRNEPIPIAYTVSREDGTFELTELPEAMVSLTALSARGHTSVDVGRDATEVTLRFTDDADTAAGILELEVRDGATGKPIPKFGTMLTRALRTQYAASGIPGRAVFDSAAAGVYELCVTADGYAPEIVPGVSIETNGRAKQSVKLGRGATVKGTLRAPEGAVPEEFDVYLTRADRLAIRGEHQPYASVDESGKFRLVALAPGTYSVIVVKRRDPDSQMLYAAKWALPVQTIVTVGAAGTESECTLDLVPGGSLDVRVNSEVLKLDWNGAPATDEQLELAATSSFTIRDVKNVVLFSSTGLDDRDLRERAVPAGVLLLRLEVAGRPPQEREVTILPGKRTRVQFDVR